MNWVEKYKPRKLNEIKINIDKLRQLRQAILEKKSIILYGNSGVGKTCSIYALANDINYEVVEVNATDLRNKENVNLIIGQASAQQSLFKEGKILLIDEVDALASIDRGGATTILGIINESKTSIILTANDPYDSKLSSVRRKCRLIKFDDIEVYDILDVLKRILKKEDVKCKNDLLLEIAKQSKGDLRAAINDLQVNALGNKEICELYNDKREKKEDIFRILSVILSKRDVRGIADKLDVDYDELLLWLEENLPRKYKGEVLVKGFDALSKADIFRSRIKRQQYWRFLVYIRDLLTYGIALAKKYENNEFTSYKRGERILKYWVAKQRYAKKRSIVDKISKSIHASTKKVLKDFFYYKYILQDDEIIDELKLDEEEIGWLKK